MSLLIDVPCRSVYIVTHQCESTCRGIVRLTDSQFAEPNGCTAVEGQVLLLLRYGSAKPPIHSMKLPKLDTRIMNRRSEWVCCGKVRYAVTYILSADIRRNAQFITMTAGVARKTAIVGYVSLCPPCYGVKTGMVEVDAVVVQIGMDCHVQPCLTFALLLAIIGTESQVCGATDDAVLFSIVKVWNKNCRIRCEEMVLGA